MKSRHVVHSLGTLTAGDTSAELDLSTMETCIVFSSRDSGTSSVWELQAAPEEFGTTGTWGRVGRMEVTQSTTAQAFPCQPSGTLFYIGDMVTPRRIRVKLTSGTDITVHVEGVRQIA